MGQVIKIADRPVIAGASGSPGCHFGDLSAQPGELGIAVHVVIGCEREQNGKDEKPRQCDNEIEPFKASPNVRRGPRCVMRMQCTKPCLPGSRYPRPVRGFASWSVTGFCDSIGFVGCARYVTFGKIRPRIARLQEVQEQVLLLLANDLCFRA